ncbi:hypothetical protein LZ32DRAFT_208279 [Colletotrichum eremochloae]|nr:hypothetical protein LZ32DRAFT_208279 [Colletotrichum eremochloae]
MPSIHACRGTTSTFTHLVPQAANERKLINGLFLLFIFSYIVDFPMLFLLCRLHYAPNFPISLPYQGYLTWTDQERHLRLPCCPRLSC